MFVGGIAGMADAIMDTYIDALDDSAETVDLVALMARALMLLLLAKIFPELPNMASSLSGGIGLSIGNTAWRGVQGLMHQAGGKHIDAWRDAARWRRVRGAEALHDRMVETRKAVVGRLLHGSNRVSRADSGTTANPGASIPILALLAGCADTPKAPTCEGPYRTLNPAHYAPVQESTSADVPILFPPNETQGS